MQPISVFLSSTYRDADLRKAARHTIEGLSEFRLVVVPESPATMRAAEGDVLRRILESDAFVILVGPSYGTKLHGQDKTFSEFEYETAKKAGKPIIALVSSGLRNLKPGSDPIWKLFARVSGERPVKYFDSIEDLRNKLTSSLSTVRKSFASSEFEIVFDPELSDEQVKGAFEALAEYYRAAGGVGLSAEFEFQQAEVREPVEA